MKQARLLWISLAVLLAGSASVAYACGDHDQQAKTSASAASTAPGAATCSGMSAAACQAAGMSAAQCRAAIAAGHASCKAAKSSAAAAGFAATQSGHAGCGGAKDAATAVYASTGHAGCAAKSAAAAVTAGGSCSSRARGASAALACKDGASAADAEGCTGHGMATVAARSTHENCDACVDMSQCEAALESAGANTQIVALKNGVMYVFTADTPTHVHAVQAAMTRRSEHWAKLATDAGKAHLCGSCKEMRGAAASGKLAREFVNIEGGCLTLITSNDPSVVAKIQTMAGLTTAAKVKS